MQIYSMLPAKALSYERVFDRVLGNMIAAADATKCAVHEVHS